MECQNSDTPVFIKRLFMECSSDVDWNLLSWNMYEAELHLGCILPSTSKPSRRQLANNRFLLNRVNRSEVGGWR